MDNTLDILLSLDIREKEEKQVKILRLSKKDKPVIFTVKALGFNRVAEIKNMGSEEAVIHLLLAGVKDPDLKDQRLLDKYGAATPVEMVKRLLLPGEIDDIAREIELLSGYRKKTLEDFKKK